MGAAGRVLWSRVLWCRVLSGRALWCRVLWGRVLWGRVDGSGERRGSMRHSEFWLYSLHQCLCKLDTLLNIIECGWVLDKSLKLFADSLSNLLQVTRLPSGVHILRQRGFFYKS